MALFEKALHRFLVRDEKLIESNASERSFCARLSIYLQDELSMCGMHQYFADAEYNRKKRAKVKTVRLRHGRENSEDIVSIVSDLLVHSRGETKPDNLITIEMKKEGMPTSAFDKDRERLEAMTVDPGPSAEAGSNEVYGWEGSDPEHVCGYLLGVFVIIDVRNCGATLEYFLRGQKTSCKHVHLKDAQSALSLPEI